MRDRFRVHPGFAFPRMGGPAELCRNVAGIAYRSFPDSRRTRENLKIEVFSPRISPPNPIQGHHGTCITAPPESRS
jgi:hypothetical protein